MESTRDQTGAFKGALNCKIEGQAVGMMCLRASLCRSVVKVIQTKVWHSPRAGTLVASLHTTYHSKEYQSFWLELSLTFTKPQTLTAFRLLVPIPRTSTSAQPKLRAF